MNPRFIPGLIDAALHAEDSITKTASYNGQALDLGFGFAPGGIGEVLAAILMITAMDETSGNETYAFTLQESSDDGVADAFTACGPTVTLSAAAASALGAIAVLGFVSKRYVRVALVAGGTTPSVTYTTDFTAKSSGL